MFLNEACKNGDIDKINLMIEKGATNFNWGLYRACLGGHIDIINLMIEKGATDFNRGLYGAYKEGYIDVINLMIEKGATDFNWGLCGAYKGGHNDVINLMIEKGARILYNSIIKRKMHKSILIYIIMHKKKIYDGDGVMSNMALLNKLDTEKRELFEDNNNSQLWKPTKERHALFPVKIKELIFTMMMIRKNTSMVKYIVKPIMWYIINKTIIDD